MNGSGRLRGPSRAVAALLVAAALAACSSGGEIDAKGAVRSDDPRAGGKSAFDTTLGEPQPTSEVIGGTTAAPGPPPSAAAPTVPSDPGQALLAAVAAFHAALGPGDPARTLQFTIHFPVGSASYASLQSQVPSAPTDVDERDWRDGVVSAPSPVVLSGIGTLDENLFALDEIDWPAIAGVLATAPDQVIAKVGPLSNSSGVTHLIATKDLPFSPDTVVRVYVDGGDRKLGGYVQYLADGTLSKVQA